MLVTPDPFRDRAHLYLYPAVFPMGNNVHPRSPDSYNITLRYMHEKSGTVLDDGSVDINCDKSIGNNWDKIVEILNSCYLDTGPNTVLVSIHNLSLIQRAGWWWSRRNNLPDPVWNANHCNRDIVNLYHGPAIITAEERFSFNINMACMSLGINVYEDPNYNNGIEFQFQTFLKLWKLLKM